MPTDETEYFEPEEEFQQPAPLMSTPARLGLIACGIVFLVVLVPLGLFLINNTGEIPWGKENKSRAQVKDPYQGKRRELGRLKPPEPNPKETLPFPPEEELAPAPKEKEKQPEPVLEKAKPPDPEKRNLPPPGSGPPKPLTHVPPQEVVLPPKNKRAPPPPQTPVAPVPPEEETEPKEKILVPGILLAEMVPGYQTRKIKGFTFLLSTQAIKEGQKDKGRAYRALVAEFDGLVRVLGPGALKVLQKFPIWIEWDTRTSKAEHAVGRFLGGPNWSDPLKTNSVEILSLKELTAEKGEEVEKSRLVLLHEMAHAVHFLVVGTHHPGVRFAYNQAMERQLYDQVKTASGKETRGYAATNEYEYFAELSCAYLDRCFYFPFTREDLREHDPTGFRLMEAVWGKGAAKK